MSRINAENEEQRQEVLKALIESVDWQKFGDLTSERIGERIELDHETYKELGIEERMAEWGYSYVPLGRFVGEELDFLHDFELIISIPF